MFESLHKKLFGEIMAEHYIEIFKNQCCINHPEMHKQFATLDLELGQVSTNADVRSRVEDRYGGFLLTTLVKQMQNRDPNVTSSDLLSHIQRT